MLHLHRGRTFGVNGLFEMDYHMPYELIEVYSQYRAYLSDWLRARGVYK